MKTSESITKIAPALLAAQRQITFAAKEATNPHFRSKYADLPAVIDAVKPALNEAGIVFMQMPAPSESGTLALCTRLIHESGEWIESTATCPLQKNDPQGYGSANTYLRRYSLAAAVGLYQDDDDGQAASMPTKQQSRGPVTGARDGIGEDLPQDWKDYLSDLAEQVSAKVVTADVPGAKKLIADANLEADQHTYMANKLSASVRAALKKG